MNSLLNRISMVSYLLSLIFVVCCVGSDSSAQVRSALDVLADVVSPASELTAAACDAREELVLGEVRKGQRSAIDGERAVLPIREKCAAIKKTIDQIRTLHDQAVLFVKSGGIDEAKAKLEQARELLRNLPNLSGGE